MNPSSVFQYHVQGNCHDATALINTVKESVGGLQIDKTVAYKLISHISGRHKLDFFTQFAHLPAFVAALRLFDVNGHYELKTTMEPNNNRFLSFYAATGWAKQLWRLLRNNITFDGCKVRTIISGCLLFVVTLGANNNLTLLATLYCASENENNATLCMQNVLEDFPPHEGCKTLVFQDAGTALIAACTNCGLDWRRCSHHTVKKCRETNGYLPADLEQLFYAFIMCTTPEAEKSLKQKMSKDFPAHSKHINWMLKKSDKIVSTNFLDVGHISLGQQSNNPCEQLNEMVSLERELPVVEMIIGIYTKMATKLVAVRDQANARSLKRNDDGKPSQWDLTPVAVEVLSGRSAEISGKVARVTLLTATKLHGSIILSRTEGTTARVELTLNLDNTGTVSCSHCRVHLDTGLLCACSIGLIVAANATRSAYATMFSIYDTRFAHPQRHTAVWVQQCEIELPVCPYSAPRGPVVKETFTVLPWIFQPRLPGRKKKDKSLKQKYKPGERTYHCNGCGLDGHSVKRCQNINLDRYRLALETNSSVTRTIRVNPFRGVLDQQAGAANHATALNVEAGTGEHATTTHPITSHPTTSHPTTTHPTTAHPTTTHPTHPST